MRHNLIRLDGAQSEIRATVANALAKALICGIDECDQNNRPLSQLQQIDLAKFSIMSYDEAIKTAEAMGVIAQIEGM